MTLREPRFNRDCADIDELIVWLRAFAMHCRAAVVGYPKTFQEVRARLSQ